MPETLANSTAQAPADHTLADESAASVAKSAAQSSAKSPAQSTAKSPAQSTAKSPARDHAATAQGKPASEAYWPQLDGLRTLAFILVFMYHLGPATPASSPGLTPDVRILNSVCTWGFSGVDLFFCLSGFLITFLLIAEKKTFGNISFKLFFARRALRIWPVYYALLFTGCVILPATAWSHLNHAKYGEFFLKQVVPMASFLGNYSTIIATKILIDFENNLALPITYFLLPLWSLAVEEQFYLTWPFVLKVLKGPRPIYLTIASLTLLSVATRGALWYVSRNVWHLPFPVRLYYQTTFSHLDPLMAGAAIAVTAFYFPQILEASKKYTPLMMLGLAVICVAIPCYFPDLNYNTNYNVGVFCLIALGCLLLLTLTLVSPAFTKVLGCAPLAKFGRLTYAMYLIHYFAIDIADGIIGELPAKLVLSLPLWPLRFAVALPLTFAFAFVSWHLLESRLQNLRKHFRRKDVA
jgi:peptidoglycan/LPS O-acetylase OafA/YrhL